MSVNEKEVVKEQYQIAQNLHTRISIHEKYSVNQQGFGPWIVSHYKIKANQEVLELGCGSGDMWKDVLPTMDPSIRLHLTDFSEGMLADARANLGDYPHVSYEQVDIQNIPYDQNRFDHVIANMMLYHVPDLNQGLSEVSRVLTSTGTFYCATFGEQGIAPYLASLLKEYGVKDTQNPNFTLQNGEAILRRYFRNVQRLDYEDALAVTDLNDLLDYIASLKGMNDIATIDRNVLEATLRKHMVNGVLMIPKEYGMFICQKS